MYAKGKMQAQKRPEKTLGLYLRLILDMETASRRKAVENIFFFFLESKLWVRGRIWLPEVQCLIQMSHFKKNQKAYKEREKYGPSKGGRDHKRVLWTTVPQQIEQPRDMNKFPETQNLLGLNQEEIENMNKQVISKEIESIMENLPRKKRPRDDLIGEFYQTFKN